jgi:response regulator NasT
MRRVLLLDGNKSRKIDHYFCKGNQYESLSIGDFYSLATHIREFKPDLIVLNVHDVTKSIVEHLQQLLRQVKVPVMVFCIECEQNLINLLIKADISYLSINEFPPCSVDRLVDIAFARFEHIKCLRDQVEDAQLQLEDRKQIDRAKAILIKTQKFTEDQAYHTLRKLAMNRNVTLGELARNVIAMAELLK